MGIVSGGFPIIQMRIETASSRLIEVVAPDKPRPFCYEKWADVVEGAIEKLNDCDWWVCATPIVGIPW